jgi:hypothetical protein
MSGHKGITLEQPRQAAATEEFSHVDAKHRSTRVSDALSGLKASGSVDWSGDLLWPVSRFTAPAGTPPNPRASIDAEGVSGVGHAPNGTESGVSGVSGISACALGSRAKAELSIAIEPAPNRMPAEREDAGSYAEETHAIASVEIDQAQRAQTFVLDVISQQAQNDARRGDESTSHQGAELPRVDKVSRFRHGMGSTN